MIIACFRKQVESCKQDLPVITNSTQIWFTPLLPVVKDYFLCLFSKRIVCKSEREVHFYRKLRYTREDWQFQIKVPGFRGRALTPWKKKACVDVLSVFTGFFQWELWTFLGRGLRKFRNLRRNTGIQKNIGDLLENLDKAMDKYNATYSLSLIHIWRCRRRG